jgi:hypothetical protein
MAEIRYKAGREPSAEEVAEHIGMESLPLGVLMSRVGVQAKLTETGNNKVRRYTFDMEERIEGDAGEQNEILAGYNGTKSIFNGGVVR